MERLTQPGYNYCALCTEQECGYRKGIIPNPCGDAAIYNKLREYEETELQPQTIRDIMDGAPVMDWLDANKEGRLLVMSCAIGQRIWYIEDNGVYDDLVYDASYGKNSNGKNEFFYSCESGYSFSEEQWGKNVFETEALARAVADIRRYGGGVSALHYSKS